MGKTEIQLLKERLILDNVSLRVRPFELDLAGYPIEMVALTAKGPYGNPVFSFVVRGLRIERIYDSYKLVFFYRTKKHNVEIEDAINEYFQPQMRLGFTGDKYEFLRSQIAMIHNDYSKDSKDTEIFVVDFQTVMSSYGEDREGDPYTKIEGEVLPTKFIELMKIRRSLDGKDRFAALLTAEDEELLEEVDKLVEKHEESKKYINFKDRDPAKELQDFLMSVKTQKGLGFMAKLIETATNEVVGKNAGMEKKKPIKVPRKPKK